MQLKNATKEGITTADIDVFVIDFGRPFDEARMEDSYADTFHSETMGASRSSGADTRVLCTVGMGLQKTVMRKIDGMPAERQVDVLLRPKVALESVLKTIAGAGAESTPTPLPGALDGRP